MADKNTIRSREGAQEGLGFVKGASESKKSIFGRIAQGLSKAVESMADSTRGRVAALGIMTGLATAKGAEANVAEMVDQSRTKVEPSAFVIKDSSHLDTRFGVFESDDRVGASASLIQSAGSTALGVGIAGTDRSQQIKAAIAHQYGHGGVVGANVLFNQSKYENTSESLQGARVGVDYSHLIDGRTSIDVGASHARTFDKNLGTTRDTRSSTRTILENGSNNTYRDTTTTETTTRYIGGSETDASLGVTHRVSDHFAVSAGASYASQMTGYGSATFANGEYAAGLGVRNIGETPRYDFFADKAIGKNTAIGVFGSLTEGQRDSAVFGARATHTFGGAPIRSTVAHLTSQTPEGKVRGSMADLENLNTIDRGIGRIETQTTTDTQAVLESSVPETPKDIQIQGLSEVVQLDQSGAGQLTFQVSGADAGAIGTNDISIEGLTRDQYSVTLTNASEPLARSRSLAPSVRSLPASSVRVTVAIKGVTQVTTATLNIADIATQSVSLMPEQKTTADTPEEISTPRLSVNADGVITIESYGIKDQDGIRPGSERLYVNGASVVSGDTLKPGTYIVQASAEVLDASTGEYKLVEVEMGEDFVVKAPEVVDTLAPTITITGPKVITLTQGDTFVMPQVTASDTTDGVVEVKIEGSIDTTKVGTQTLKLTAVDKAGNIGSDSITVNVEAPKDTLAPTITITGPKVITLTQGDTFVMPQVTASDTTDGVVEVKIEGSIDTTKVGTQILKLTATDMAGNIGADSITVNVKAKEIIDDVAPKKVSEDLPFLDNAGSTTTGTITLSEAVDRVTGYRYVDSAGLDMIGFQGGALTVLIDPSDAKKLVLNYTVPHWISGNPTRVEVDVVDKAGNAATIVTQGYNVN